MTDHYSPQCSMKAFLFFLRNELDTDLQSISDWAYQWKMRCNPDPIKQAQELYFARKINKDDFQNLSFNESNVETCSCQKHLGLIMDDKLNFDVHVQNKITTCHKIIGIVRRLSVIIHGMPY